MHAYAFFLTYLALRTRAALIETGEMKQSCSYKIIQFSSFLEYADD